VRIIQIAQVTGEDELEEPADGSIQNSMMAHLDWMREYARGLRNTNPSQKGRKIGPPRRNESSG